ncbi:hypothetical protein GEV38_21710 [Pseudomonas sp. 13159349]|nr:hypothetical protein GEV38_21710 [Pseudomonas sp. 13159349]
MDPDGLATATEPCGAESLVMGPWPSYAGARHLPERERWVVYSTAKAYRAAMEEQGITMAEPYDQFVQRVTAELEI